MKRKIELVATSAFGIEAITKRELNALGFDELKTENGRTSFKAELADIARVNINIRTADRILLKVGEFRAESFEELFEGANNLPWGDIISKDGNFIVEGRSHKSKLFSISDCQRIVEKAIVEKLKQKYNQSWFQKSGARYKIEIAMLNDIATITIDTSGEGLHKRGYRERQKAAPIKETLAAAMVMLSYWDTNRLFYDPFCGSGTLAIEAALIGKNIAPGLDRKFDAERWSFIDADIWKNERRKAQSAIRNNIKLNIMGSDIDHKVVLIARDNAANFGLEDDITFFIKDFQEVELKNEYGVLVTNPPYGDRLSEINDVKKMYRKLGEIFKPLDMWSEYIISSHDDFEKSFGRKADRKRKLFNGNIKTNYYQFYGPRPPKEELKGEKNEDLHKGRR